MNTLVQNLPFILCYLLKTKLFWCRNVKKISQIDVLSVQSHCLSEEYSVGMSLHWMKWVKMKIQYCQSWIILCLRSKRVHYFASSSCCFRSTLLYNHNIHKPF